MLIKRLRSRSLIGLLAFAACAGLAGGVIGLPEYIARQASQAAESCIDLTQSKKRCRFIGGPLQMEGQPVFMEDFAHAFLPTKQQIDFVDAGGQVWTAPPRTLTDGATIPPIFAPLVGDRQSREYLMAAALHDAYCGVGNEGLSTWRDRPWDDVHRMFYEALLVNGTPPKKAKLMFAAVYLGGPRWDDPERDLTPISTEMLIKEMEWCLEWIRLKDPSITRILSWMEEREKVMKSGNHTKPEYLKKAQDPRGT